MQTAYSETRSARASDKQACSSVQGIVVFGIGPYTGSTGMQGGGGGRGHGSIRYLEKVWLKQGGLWLYGRVMFRPEE